MLLGLSDLLPSTSWGTEEVNEGYVVSTGPQLLCRLGVPFHELVEC